MRYAEFEFYTGVYRGSLVPSVRFDYYAGRASDFVEDMTFSRIPQDAVPDAVKSAVCALAELEYKIDNNLILSSESVGGMSVSYAVGTVEPSILRKNILKTYLASTGLLYRGVM